MDKKIVRGMSEAGRAAADKRSKAGASKRPVHDRDDPRSKGTMHQPAQTADGERGAVGETQEALEDYEKEKGDWSKGG